MSKVLPFEVPNETFLTTRTELPRHGAAKPSKPHLRILGIRGVPAKHGGFETFAEQFAPYMVQQGWRVTVYCQQTGSGEISTDYWRGVCRVNIPSGEDTAASTVLFDLRSCLHARNDPGVCLTLGYNTAVFMALLRRSGITNIINMDGIEYARPKWGPMAKLWLRLNERAAIWFADHLIADHPGIFDHLRRKSTSKPVTVIAYGSDALGPQPTEPIEKLGLVPGKFMSVIARPEPENSLLEIVTAFSARPRGVELAVLGNYNPSVEYHRAVQAAAGPEVRFLGAIYDAASVKSLRYHSLAYVHGHQVGGSNPSLIEALGAGNAVIAHDNQFNRWVAGPGALFFKNSADLSHVLDEVEQTPALLQQMREASRERHADGLTWEAILSSYNQLIRDQLAVNGTQPVPVDSRLEMASRY
jgi:glycosyltransferase involved in cell wall biosynthesis